MLHVVDEGLLAENEVNYIVEYNTTTMGKRPDGDGAPCCVAEPSQSGDPVEDVDNTI